MQPRWMFSTNLELHYNMRNKPLALSLQSLLYAAAAGILLCPLQAEPAAAPPPSPNVRGNIYDSTRTTIPGATITATLEGRAMGQSTSSGHAGEFGLFSQPGNYEFRIAADGYKHATKTVVVGTTPPA